MNALQCVCQKHSWAYTHSFCKEMLSYYSQKKTLRFSNAQTKMDNGGQCGGLQYNHER